MKSRSLVLGLALSTVAFAGLMPPEAYPAGRLAIAIAATFAFLATLSEGRISRTYASIGLAGTALLLAHSMWISVDLYRSLEFLTQLWTYYCLFGALVYSGTSLDKPTAAVLIAVSFIISAYGLYQFFFGFDELYSYVAYSGSDEIAKVPALQTIASKRVFSTLALPGTLWGFLLTALPLHLVWWGRSRWLNAALALSASAAVATCLLTRSFGFLAGVLITLLLWVCLHRRMYLRNVWVWLVIVSVLAGGAAFYQSRAGAIETSNPLTLRFMNWLSAWAYFSDNPLGAGLNNYGVVYPQYALPGSNETQFVHNTPLQFLNELGVLAIAIAFGAAWWLAGRRRWGAERTVPAWLPISLGIWIVHNLIDINVYFPSVGVVGVFLLAMIFVRQSDPVLPSVRWQKWTFAALSFTFLVFSGVSAVTSELQHRARVEQDEGRLSQANATLNLARRLMPINSSLHHDSGELLHFIFHKLHKTESLPEAMTSFQDAIRWSPSKIGPHIGLGLCLSASGRLQEALAELQIAQEFHPTSQYVESIRRLIEKRIEEESD